MAASRENGSVSNHSSDRSPLHPQSHQSRGAGRAGSASPAFERKSAAEGMLTANPSTPGRNRARIGGSMSSKSAEQSDKISVPKFGAWDANDPSSGDGFTVIFNKARDEKKSAGSLRNQSLELDSSSKHTDEPYKKTTSSKWYCCFQSTQAEI